jgi:hypothetical protein
VGAVGLLPALFILKNLMESRFLLTVKTPGSAHEIHCLVFETRASVLDNIWTQMTTLEAYLLPCKGRIAPDIKGWLQMTKLVLSLLCLPESGDIATIVWSSGRLSGMSGP